MSDQDELSEDELDALISDLESRSDGGGDASADLDAESPEGEELEALLEDVDQEADEPSADPKVADREGPEAGPDLSELDVADEVPAETGESAPEPADTGGGGEKTADEAAEAETPDEQEQTDRAADGEAGARSKVWSYLWIVAKWTGYALPVVAFWWILGSYLGQWISAGWLIALVATMFVVGIPKVLYDLADKRGRFRWWLAGTSLVLTTALVAPMADEAGEVLTRYGHWPATTVSEITGSPGGFLLDANAAAGETIGRTLAPDLPVQDGARPLGQ